ncbi:putative membrane-bound metal-dependent hydrolase [Spongiibacter sp. IMCC21906]|uniref:metal-dependent hydrolase n=1 Tax=Spongiibacter sp. IMCC21906 TaxID=1620392 RepID=UPI00062DFEC4|nr:metal-dependent hydrolase [Spongiibacter sp. IMCC21906]AKH69092.1 putative membrane-bound metal-dependent hydrolase [Spongiibacter sp. IMCC21906]
MDPLTQGVLGITAAQNTGKSTQYKASIAGIGLLAGMAADLDVFIRANNDPLLFLEYHRQFTHSLIFIPFAGILLGVVLYGLFARRSLTLRQSMLFATLGYATHGLLDACTTYGTQLLWPFNNARVAWNILSIIDPLYTLPLCILCALALSPKRSWAARLALCWALAYPGLGWLQRERAESAGLALAQSRGHHVEQIEAKPSFANILLWKTIYRYKDRFYVDAVRVGSSTKIYPGESLAALNISRDLPWLPPTSVQAEDVERFRWFSNGYVALDPLRPNRVIDIRYSLLPNEIDALWSIELNPAKPEQHVQFQSHRENTRSQSQRLLHMLNGSD